jgi:cell division protein ZapA (FtsZ GTPase activity inhibitor)
MPPSTEIKVYGKTYTVKASASAVPPQELADYVDAKMHELAKTPAGKTSIIDLAILAAINIAQESFRDRKDKEETLETLEERIHKLAERVKNELDRRQ